MLIPKIKSEHLGSGFSRSKHLSTPSEFKAVFQAAKKTASRDFAFYMKQNNLSYPRLGVIVAKKNVRKATARNLIKRIVRERFRLGQANLVGFDVVVVIYRGFSLLTKPQMHLVIQKALKR